MRPRINISAKEASEMYLNGETIKAIAKHFGCSAQTIARRLSYLGLMKVKEDKQTCENLDYFQCSRFDCFGCMDGHCIILISGYEDDYKCKFYKKKTAK